MYRIGSRPEAGATVRFRKAEGKHCIRAPIGHNGPAQAVASGNTRL